MTGAEIKIVKVPLLDTGIGREAGFKDDAELIAADRAQRRALTPEARRLLEKIDAKTTQAFLFGED